MDASAWREAEQERLVREYLARSPEERAERRAAARVRLGWAAPQAPPSVTTHGYYRLMRGWRKLNGSVQRECAFLSRSLDRIWEYAERIARERGARRAFHWIERESHPATVGRRRAA